MMFEGNYLFVDMYSHPFSLCSPWLGFYLTWICFWWDDLKEYSNPTCRFAFPFVKGLMRLNVCFSLGSNECFSGFLVSDNKCSLFCWMICITHFSENSLRWCIWKVNFFYLWIPWWCVNCSCINHLVVMCSVNVNCLHSLAGLLLCWCDSLCLEIMFAVGFLFLPRECMVVTSVFIVCLGCVHISFAYTSQMLIGQYMASQTAWGIYCTGHHLHGNTLWWHFYLYQFCKSLVIFLMAYSPHAYENNKACN